MALVLAMASAATAQESHEEHAAGGAPSLQVRARRAASAITLDGRLTEPAWTDAVPVGGFVQQEPRTGEPSTERTEARVLYDEDGLYVALRAFDQAPDSIVGELARRDQQVFSDWVAVVIDSYHDRRSASFFAVNPAGVKVDSRITGDNNADGSWDAVWDAGVARDAEGWTAEFRIPFSQLRYNRMQDGGVWGINFRRQIARRGEMAFWAPIEPNSDAFVSRFGELHGLPALRPPQRAEVLPYTVARVTREPGNRDNPYFRSSAWDGSVGADLKFAVTPALTLNATINPDFGQVEADPSVVNLSAFETFLSERRPFFVEGADLFRTNGPQVLYSRRIGRAPQVGLPNDALYEDAPVAATILGAAKLTGRTQSGWSIGLLQAVTAEERGRYTTAAEEELRATVEPLTSYTVGRVGRDFRRGQSALGVLVTAAHRDLDEDNLRHLRENAYTLTVDGRHRFGGGNYEVSGVVTNSLVTGDTAAIALTQRGAGHYFLRPDATHLDYDPTRESLSGRYAQLQVGKVAGGNWRWATTAQITTPTFEINDVGFNGSSDRMQHSMNLGYYSTQPKRLLRRWSIQTSTFGSWTTAGDRSDYVVALNLSTQLHNLWGASASFMRHHGGAQPDAMRGGPAVTNPGSYMIFANANTDERKPVSATMTWFANWEVGSGGYTQQLNPLVTFRPTARANLSIGPSFNLDLENSQWVATRSVHGSNRYVASSVEQRTVGLSTRLNYTFSPTLSLQVYAQPFVGAAEFSGFKEVRNPRADDFDAQFHVLTPDELEVSTSDSGDRSFAVDYNRDGAVDYRFNDPSFNSKALQSTSVLRWEYRPGSALFLVWSHDRSRRHADGSFDLRRDLSRLGDAKGRNVLLLKASYWLGL